MPTKYNLTLKEKIGQLFMIGFKGNQLPEETCHFIETNNIGFIVLFARNIDSVAGVKELTRQIHNSAKIPPFIYTDQEGGTVVQFKELAATVVSPMGIAATGNPRNARLAANIIGEEMKALGVDGVLAPTLDVNFEEKNPIIGIRSYADEPEQVITFAREFVTGMHEKGMPACGKHYPGHGGTVADSHLEMPVVQISPEYFFHYCFTPFRTLVGIGIDAVMSSHVLFPAISPDIATFSPRLIRDLLRGKAGFNGLVMSDCLEMKAVKDNYSPSEIVKQSINAGLDLLIASHSPDFQQELVDSLFFYVQKGIIPEKRIDESLERILRLKENYPPPRPLKGGMKMSVHSRGAEDGEDAVRTHRWEEERIADRSITLLRNRTGVIPINPGARTLVIEWEKVQATMLFSSAAEIFYMEPAARQFLSHVDFEILKLASPTDVEEGRESIPPSLRNRLNEYDCIIAGLYSRSPAIETFQAGAVKEIFAEREDVIVVAMGNPYDIRNFPSVHNYVVTYGFRRVQMEALFKVLTGKIVPSGKLPVQIRGLFPKNYALGADES
jgi:beta-N-acetylhexosaminidase